MKEFNKLIEYLRGMEARNIAKQSFELKRIKIQIEYMNREEHTFIHNFMHCEVDGGCNAWYLSFFKGETRFSFRIVPGITKLKQGMITLAYDQHHTVTITPG